MSKNNTPYIEEFNKKFVNHGEFIYNKGSYPATSGDVLAFITKTIESEREKAVEDFITKMYGKRCKEIGIGCVVCAMWELYDEYINKLKKK